MFQHVGLTIHDEADVEAFYQNILGLQPEKRFEVESGLSERLFGIRNAVSVVVLSRGDFAVELFLGDWQADKGYHHIGISIPDRNEVMEKAKAGGYAVSYIERESKPALLFIRDRSGNAFEVREE
jgi:catechol 2,3-dioxygenase-like lactoylglutathione lyase family enzyme